MTDSYNVLAFIYLETLCLPAVCDDLIQKLNHAELHFLHVTPCLHLQLHTPQVCLLSSKLRAQSANHTLMSP